MMGTMHPWQVHTVASLENEITSTQVKLVPPYRPFELDPAMTDTVRRERWQKFEANFKRWCLANWELAKLDPTELDISRLYGPPPPRGYGRTLTNVKITGLMLNPDGTTALVVADMAKDGLTYLVPGNWRNR